MAFITTQKRRAVQPLWNALLRFVKPHAGQGVLLAISGGPDSMALLEALAVHPMRQGGRFVVVCVDHQTRLGSLQDAQKTVGRAKVLGFEAVCVSVHAPKKDEATLRACRYEALMQTMRQRGCHSICTAHHADDQAEGFLMHVLGMGGGKEGASCLENTPFKEAQLLRPFVNLYKSDLLCALTALGQAHYVLDPLDACGGSKRAQIREHALSQLQRYHPRIKQRLALLARRMGFQNEQQRHQSSRFVHVSPDSTSAQVQYRLMDTHNLFVALQHALQSVSLKSDLRSATRALQSIANQLSSPDCLDQAGFLVSLSGSTSRFCLPGAVAVVSEQEITLFRTP